MLKKIINIIKYGNKASSESYIKYLRSIGVEIGEGVRFFAPMTNTIDIQNPFMIQIGNNVRITKGVAILTHDYSWSVLTGLEGILCGSISKVNIGNNVFIGINSIILRGVNIGNNVIIGAGSIVSKNCKDNSVYAGNPAKYIMSIEEFYKKRLELQYKEAKELAQNYYKKTGKLPDEKIMEEYFYLFTDYSKNVSTEIISRIKRTGYYEICIDKLKKNKPKFKDIDEFLQSCSIGNE